MRLIKARVRGFQSFSDSGEVIFSDGMNLIIGQNNAGKSAFLRALLPVLTDDRHRTPDKWEQSRLPPPRVDFGIYISGAEIRDAVLRSGGQQYLPITMQQTRDLDAAVQEFFERPSITFSVSREPSSPFIAPIPSHQLFEPNSDGAWSAILTPRHGEVSSAVFSHARDTLPSLLHSAWERDLFYFAAERMSVGESHSGYANRLLPNASNLPNVLHTLNNERGDIFRRLVHHLREVFPTVGNLSVRTHPDRNVFEVRVWPTEAMERVELSFPLNFSGTGVSQVISLLTAIMTIDKAVVIIDEINSFLHPAAVKALLRILQTQYAQHQYIISTHAPEVISFSNPKTIHLVKRVGYESSIEPLDLIKVGNFREVAEHLGVSMADVFAAEHVIWVEGPTEELCFPYIYQKLIGPLPLGTIITSVAATGDFNTKRRDQAIVYEVYRRLSTAAATLVVKVTFSFDTEKLNESEKEEMQRKAGGSLHFLPRRHLECYLIDPNAIAAFIVSKDPASIETITPEVVEEALRAEASTPRLKISQWSGDISDANWLAHVDGANLIASVCGNLSEQRAPFMKKDDSLFLLRHTLERDPEQLRPLCDYVASLVDVGKEK